MRFQRSIKLGKGVRLNLSKSGIGISTGIRGLRYAVGPGGQRITVGIPGTGLSHTIYLDRERREARAERDTNGDAAALSAPEPSIGASTTEKQYRAAAAAFVAGDFEKAAAHAVEAAGGTEGRADALLLQAISTLQTGKGVEEGIEACVALLEWHDGPLPGENGSLTAKYLPGAVVGVPITPYNMAMLPLNTEAVPFIIAELLQSDGDSQGAAEALEQIVGEAAENRMLALALLEIYFRGEMFDRLYEFASGQTTALQNSDNIGLEMMVYWAAALAHKEMYEAAKEVYKAALAKSKDRDPDLLRLAQYARADLFVRWGKPAEARKYFEKLFAESPGFKDVKARVEALRR